MCESVSGGRANKVRPQNLLLQATFLLPQYPTNVSPQIAFEQDLISSWFRNIG